MNFTKGSATRSLRPSKAPDIASVHNEAALEHALEDLYQEWGAMGFWAKRLHQKFTPGRARYAGGIAAARGILTSRTGGFAFLKEHECLDLSIEHLILRPEWRGLFCDDDRRLAQRRLERAKR